MQKNLVYESTLYEYGIIYFAILTLILFFLLYSYNFLIKTKREKIIVLFLSLFLTLSLYGIYEKIKLSKVIQDAINLNSFFIEEGDIKGFYEMPKSGHDIESFKVNNEYFKIVFTGDYPKDTSLYYTLTKNRNGPIIKNGQKVKIHYLKINYENKIIKMWIKK